MVLFSLAVMILFAGSLPWVAVARISGKTAWFLSLYLIGSANVVLTGYIANSLHALNQEWVVMGIHVVIGGFGWLVWKQVGRPALWGAFQNWRPNFGKQWMRREPALSLLAFIIFLFYGFALAQIILIPQNNPDSLSTHLSRIGFWRQHGSFFPWPTFMLNQVWYPVNAQLQTYWTLLFLGNDRLVGIVQWLSALVSGAGVFGMARFYGYTVRQSAFAALTSLSFPLVALQSTTTQADLAASAFFIPAAYFLLLGVKRGGSSHLVLSAISIGLGIGVKKSYFLLLPVLVILAILAAIQFGKRSYKQFVIWSLNIVLGILLFGAYGYVVNWHNWGGPFGLPTYVDTLLETSQGQSEVPKARPRLNHNNTSNSEKIDSNPVSDILLELAYNVPRLLYQAIDTSGLPRPLDGYAHKVKMRVAEMLFRWVGFEEIEGIAYTAPGHTFNLSDKNINEESHAWYGPLSVLLLFPALVVGFRRGLRTRNYLLLAPVIGLLVFLPMEVILRPGWDPYQGRYFAPLVALGAPLMAHWFKEKGNAFYEWLIVGLAGVIITVTMLYNPSKPTLGKYADEFHVWNNDRIFIQTIQRKTDRAMYYKVEKSVPEDATLGYYIPFYFLDYPLFGEGLNRRLMPVTSSLRISDLQWLREHGIDFLLLPRGDKYPLPPPAYQPISKMESWALYEYNATP